MKKLLLVTVVGLSLTVAANIGTPGDSGIAGEEQHPLPSVQQFAGEKHPLPDVTNV